MLGHDQFTPEQRVVSAKLKLDRLERDLKQIFRRASKDKAIAQIMLWHKKANGFLHSPPHLVDQLVCAAAAYGSDSTTQELKSSRFSAAVRACLEVGNPAHMIWLDRTDGLEMLMPVIYREQVQLQLNANNSIYARLYNLYIELLDVQARLRIESSLGANLLGLIHASYFLSVVSLMPLRANGNLHLIGVNAIEAYEQTKLAAGGLDDLLRLFKMPVNDFGELYKKRRKDLVSKEYARSLKPLLLDNPLLELSSKNSIMPLPNTLPFSLHWLIGDKAREGHSSIQFSNSFANYTRKVVDSLAPLVMRKPDEEDHNGRRCDILAVFEDWDLLIECKATRFKRNIITPESIVQDTSTGKIVSACEQLAMTVDDGREHVSAVVLDDSLAVPNSDWYWELIFERFPGTQDHVRTIGHRPHIWSLEVLEGIVEVCLATGISIPDLVIKYQEQPYHVHGEWDTWLSRFRKEFHTETPVEMLDWKQACVDDYFLI